MTARTRAGLLVGRKAQEVRIEGAEPLTTVGASGSLPQIHRRQTGKVPECITATLRHREGAYVRQMSRGEKEASWVEGGVQREAQRCASVRHMVK